jgi:glycosyltransferase involved in cell wall biosynthesis
MPRVSVIIPAHDAGEFLPEALRSVQAQLTA